jgi:hypothetical protein
MASAVSSEKIGSSIYVKSYDHDPGATTAILAGPDGGTTIRYLDMKEYDAVGVMVKPNVVAAGGTTKVELVASATTAFSSVTVVKDSGTVAADALDDNVFLECTASEVVQLGATLRYVAARLTNATNTDEATVTYIGIPKRKYTGLTATAIA